MYVVVVKEDVKLGFLTRVKMFFGGVVLFLHGVVARNFINRDVGRDMVLTAVDGEVWSLMVVESLEELGDREFKVLMNVEDMFSGDDDDFAVFGYDFGEDWEEVEEGFEDSVLGGDEDE